MRSLDTGDTPVLTLRVPWAQREKINREARKHGLSRSQFLREAISVILGDRCCLAPVPENCPHAADSPDTGACGHKLAPTTQRSKGLA